MAPLDESQRPHCSIVVPMHNEEESAPALYEKIVAVMEGTGCSFEIVFVNDGSADRTLEILRGLAERDPRVHIISLKRNFGQTSALAAGFDYARGEIIISMDGDLQHDPADIPLLVEKIEEGYDLVSGWRKERVDNFWLRRLPSLIANFLMAKLSGVPLHDFGTTFKAYRRSVIKNIQLFGELHRFIPALASQVGAKIVEVPIRNIVRPVGKSHYNLWRTPRVLFDLITVKFLMDYITRPLHFFGPLGLLSVVVGSGIGLVLLIKKLVSGESIFIQHGLLIMFAAVLIIAGIQLISVGLLGELLSRTYFESQRRPIYTIDKIYNSHFEESDPVLKA